ncbi:hypothetical protein Bca52824_018077 [Brassica carinata]|uniref:Uncharacterized protein n=1 Tax=Brassica carinata TaxID=52824 RepID=A0A8X7VQ81_BRACI|nr:hypothetical protein Bca52824_018077 [Brassica carinata]
MFRFSCFQSQAAVPTISLSKTLEGSEMVATVANLSHFVFGIVQLCLMSNRVTWRRHKTDNFESVSACMQWIGLSSNSWDTDLWRRHFGTVIEAHGAVTTEVVLAKVTSYCCCSKCGGDPMSTMLSSDGTLWTASVVFIFCCDVAWVLLQEGL